LFYIGSVPTAQGLVVTFKQYQWGGFLAGDGIVFALAVAPPQPGNIGGGGGALGYIGMPGAWLGIGLDAFGNFTNSDSSSCAPPPWVVPGLAYPNEVTARGPGFPGGALGNVGYCLLSSSAQAGEAGPLGPEGFQLHGFDRASSQRSVKIIIDPVAGTYSVGIDPAGGTSYIPVTSGPLPSSTTTRFLHERSRERPPPTITFGWTASTGLADDVHEITDVARTLCATGFTTSFAQSARPSWCRHREQGVTLGDLEIDESQAGVLSTGGVIDTLPSR
jgi:hypothetical protein